MRHTILTSLSTILLIVALAFLILATVSTPVATTLKLASSSSYTYGIFGYCDGSECPKAAYPVAFGSLDAGAKWFLASSTRNTLSKAFIVAPIAAGLTFFALVFTVLSLCLSASALKILSLVFTVIAFFASAVIAVMVVLVFHPHVEWLGWLLVAAAGCTLVAVPVLLFSITAREDPEEDSASDVAHEHKFGFSKLDSQTPYSASSLNEAKNNDFSHVPANRSANQPDFNYRGASANNYSNDDRTDESSKSLLESLPNVASDVTNPRPYMGNGPPSNSSTNVNDQRQFVPTGPSQHGANNAPRPYGAPANGFNNQPVPYGVPANGPNNQPRQYGAPPNGPNNQQRPYAANGVPPNGANNPPRSFVANGPPPNSGNFQPRPYVVNGPPSSVTNDPSQPRSYMAAGRAPTVTTSESSYEDVHIQNGPNSPVAASRHVAPNYEASEGTSSSVEQPVVEAPYPPKDRASSIYNSRNYGVFDHHSTVEGHQPFTELQDTDEHVGRNSFSSDLPIDSDNESDFTSVSQRPPNEGYSAPQPQQAPQQLHQQSYQPSTYSSHPPSQAQVPARPQNQYAGQPIQNFAPNPNQGYAPQPVQYDRQQPPVGQVVPPRPVNRPTVSDNVLNNNPDFAIGFSGRRKQIGRPGFATPRTNTSVASNFTPRGPQRDGPYGNI